MARQAEIEAWARLDALTKEKTDLLNSVKHLEVEKEEVCAIRSKANDRAEALANEINAKLFPRMSELTTEIRILAVGLAGKPRPEAK